MPKLRKFDTKVQYMKYKVLREVARLAWDGTLDQHLLDIPKTIVPGREPTMRCCVYKERAILAERVKLAMGGDPENPNVIEALDIACDECRRRLHRVRGLPRLPCAPLRGRLPARSDPVRRAPEGNHQQGKVRQLWPLRKRLPIQRDQEPQAPLRERL